MKTISVLGVVGGGWGVDPAGQPDAGYAAVVSHHAIRGALFDQLPIQPPAPGVRSFLMQELDPIPLADDEHWVVNTNLHRQEVYVKRYTEQTVYFYRQNLNRNILSTNYHLGDSSSAYPGTLFIGMNLTALSEKTGITGIH